MNWLQTIFGVVFVAAWFGLAYWLWPEDLIARPARAIGSIVSVLIGLVGVWAVAEGNQR